PEGLLPESFVRVPTLFQSVKAAGGRTAFISKYPGYSVLNGPPSAGPGLDNFRSPVLKDFPGTEEAYDAANFDTLVGWIEDPTPPTLMGLYALLPNDVMKEHGIDSPETRAALAFEDGQIGRVVAALQRRGLTETTAIVVTADHGNQAID